MATPVRNQRITRLWGLGVVFLLICLVYVIRLGVLELSSENIGGHRQDGTTERTVIVQAVRGQIYDRNGVPLVTNAYTYNLTLDYSVLPTDKDARNKAMLQALYMLETCGEADRFCTYDFPFAGYYPSLTYRDVTADPASDTHDTLLSVVETNGLRREAILRIKSDRFMNTAEATDVYEADPLAAIPAERLIDYFLEEYGLTDERGEPLYSDADTDRLLRMLWGMEATGFSRANDYVMAKDVTMETLTHEKELGIAGIGFTTDVTRVCNYPGYASHILGQTGPIYAEEWEEYRELGYNMNATVGKSGCEAAFEAYLHGQDGVKVVVEDEDGHVVREYMKTEPVAGQDVYLTIDIHLQIAAEEALADNIEYIRTTFANRDDCEKGAIVAMDPHTGEVLAIASYPTYDLTTYNRDYNILAADETQPLLNRALSGLYAPGSTFKPGMVIAGLMEGVLTRTGRLECAGTYTYYQSYQPDCWIYNSTTSSVKRHGWINAAEALRVSCNCFFYETGRLLGIGHMNHYCRMLGLGEATGIELGEQRGSLAGPDHRADLHGLEWQPTDTIAAAIGQSDNAFTPLQLGVYTSTLVNGGTRYAAHLLYKVRDFSTREDTVVSTPRVLDSFDIPEEYRLFMIEGMEQMVATSTDVRHYMRNVPVTVAGKTGTAQTGANSTENGLFICCAPSRDPEIVVVSVIERAGGGSYSAMAAGDVLEAYYKNK